jgi:plastocyanin
MACVVTGGAVVGGSLAVGLGAGTATTAAPAAEPVAQKGFGTIKGRLVWGGAEAPKKVALKIDKDVEACAKMPLYDPELIVDGATKGVANAFVYLPTPKGSNPAREKELIGATPKVVIDQVGCEFVPISAAVHKDQQIEFKSSDPVGHNVHYIGFANNNNFMLNPNGASEKKLVPEKRPINLVCDIHPWMKANIMVFNHPFFAVTKEDGSFEITGVPAGTQNVIVWQRKAGYVNEGGSRGVAVEVKADGVTDIGEIKLDPAKIK